MDRIYVMELVRSFQSGEISRRAFLTRSTRVLGGVVAANMLLSAFAGNPTKTPPPVVEGLLPPEPETRSPDGLITATAEYPDVDGKALSGYLARLEKADPLPAMVVIQEWWGINAHIKDVTRRFALEGFITLAPDLYHGVVVSEPDEARKLVMELDMDAAVREIRQGIKFLQMQKYVAHPKVGIVGFCMGGRLTLQTARVEDDLSAAVAFYGSPLTPQEAAEVKAPLLGLYGAADASIPIDKVRTMEAALDKAGIENEIHIYEGAGHAFFNDTAASYNAEAAKDAWPRTVNWFRDHSG